MVYSFLSGRGAPLISNPMENYRAKLGRDALCYVPKCYGTGVVDGLSGPAIILEDFGTDARGLKPIPLTEYHTREQVRRCRELRNLRLSFSNLEYSE